MPDCEEVSSLEVVPLTVVGVATVELSMLLDVPEDDPIVVPVAVSLAL